MSAKGEVPSLFAMVEEAMAIDENGADIVIDFDVGRSFLYDGDGRFTFIPYLRAITRSGSGAIRGRLLSSEDGTPLIGYPCHGERNQQIGYWF